MIGAQASQACVVYGDAGASGNGFEEDLDLRGFAGNDVDDFGQPASDAQLESEDIWAAPGDAVLGAVTNLFTFCPRCIKGAAPRRFVRRGQRF